MTSRAQAGRARGGSLNREEIVDQAMALVESAGSRGFSLNALAQRLGVTTMALYWHFQNREAVLLAMFSRLMDQLRFPADDLPWDVWLTEYARRYRDLMHRHPHLAVMLSTSLEPRGTPDYPVAEKVMSVCSRGGFTGAELVQVYNVYVMTLAGFVAVELSEIPADHTAEWARARQEEIEGLDGEVYPTLVAHSQYLDKAAILRWRDGVSAPLDATFELLLETLVGSLRLRSQQWGSGT